MQNRLDSHPARLGLVGQVGLRDLVRFERDWFGVRSDGAIVLIDFGMVGRLDDQLQDILLRVGLAVIR